MESKKRKREADSHPRITYHSKDRTFERLFKEVSLEETKKVVRRKLGLADDARISLAQLRDGKTIDLEDDDDFDAFRALTQSVSSVDVQVIVGRGEETSRQSPKKGPAQTPTRPVSGVIASVPSVATVAPPTPFKHGEKRKVTFFETDRLASVDSSADVTQPKKRRRRKVAEKDGSVHTDTRAPSGAPSTAQNSAKKPVSKAKHEKSSNGRDSPPGVVEILASYPSSTEAPLPTSRSNSIEATARQSPLQSISERRGRSPAVLGTGVNLPKKPRSKSYPRPQSTPPVDASPRGRSQTVANPHDGVTTHKAKEKRSQSVSAADKPSVVDAIVSKLDKKQKKKKAASDALGNPVAADIVNTVLSGASKSPESAIISEVQAIAKKKSKSKNQTAGVAESEAGLSSVSLPPQDPPKDKGKQRSKEKSTEKSKDQAKTSDNTGHAKNTSPSIPVLTEGSEAAHSSKLDDDARPRKKRKSGKGDAETAPLVDHSSNNDVISGVVLSESIIDSSLNSPEDTAGPVVKKANKKQRTTEAKDPQVGLTSDTPEKPADGVKDSMDVDEADKLNQSSSNSKSKSAKVKKQKPAADAPVLDISALVANAIQSVLADMASSIPHDEGAAAEGRSHMPVVPKPRKAPAKKSKLSTTWGPDSVPVPLAADGDIPTNPRLNEPPVDRTEASVSSPPASSQALRKTLSPGKIRSTGIACPVCLGTPFHLRYQCPVVTAGPESIKNRVKELKEDKPASHETLIQELEGMLSKRRRSSASNPGTVSGSLSASNADSSTAGRAQSLTEMVPAALHDRPSEQSTTRAPWKPVLPVGLEISEVTVQSRDEGSSSESSDSGGEDERHEPVVKTSIDPLGLVTALNSVSAYTDSDLAAVINGPPTSKLSIASILSAAAISDEEEKEEVVLEEDDDERDDCTFRRLSRRFEREGSSSDDESELPVNTDVDGNSASPKPSPARNENLEENSQNPESDILQSTVSKPVNASDELQEPGLVVAHALGDSSTVDDAVVTAAPAEPAVANIPDSETSEDETRVASVTDDQEKDASAFQPDPLEHSEKCGSEPAKSSTGSTELDMPLVTGHSVAENVDHQMDVDSSQDGGAGATVTSEAGSRDPSENSNYSTSTSPIEPSHRSENVSSAITEEIEQEPSSIHPNISEDQIDAAEIDPIVPALEEPASDPIEEDHIDDVPRFDLSSQSTPKSGMAKLMKTRTGKLPIAAELPVPVAYLEKANDSVTPLPSRVIGSRKLAAQVSGTQGDGADQSIARRTRNGAHRSISSIVELSPPVPTPTPAPKPATKSHKKLTEQEKEERAAARQAAREAKKLELERVRQEKARLKLEAKAAKEAEKKQKKPLKPAPAPKVSIRVDSQNTPVAAAARPRAPPPSLAKWDVLEQSSSGIPDSSMAVDQLLSSSPGHPDQLLLHVAEKQAKQASNDETQAAEHHNQHESEETPRSKEPLFDLGTSQVPFPYSQWDNSTQPEGLHGGASPAPSSSGTEESEIEHVIKKSVTLRGHSSSTTPYRRLTDIASQNLFSSQAILTPTALTLRPKESSKLNALYGRSEDDDEEEEEEEDDADSDSEVEKKTSHIPESRKAGSQISKVKGAAA